MKFSEHDDYQDLSHAHDYLWQDLLTENGGFLIKLDEEGVAHRHGIGMFHQLHCLQMIRRALQNRAPAEGNGRNRHMRHGFREDEDDGHDPELHMLHCFDYLRQVWNSHTPSLVILSVFGLTPLGSLGLILTFCTIRVSSASPKTPSSLLRRTH